MKAGTFKKNKNGTLRGRIQALGLGNLDALFEERTSKDGNPYFKIVADPDGAPFEIGYAWPKEKDGLHYYSVRLDTIYSAKPVNAALFPDKQGDNQFDLIWRPIDVTPKAAMKTDEKKASAQVPEPKAALKTPKKRSHGMNASP
jgi:uncharacterized protein (DUF736 family)